MKRLSVNEAKAHFPSVIREVEGGETVVTMRHNKPVIELHAIRRTDTFERCWTPIPSCGPRRSLPNLFLARELLLDLGKERFVSVVSMWELQIKHGQGKLPLPGKLDVECQRWLAPLQANLLGLEVSHLGKLYDLPAIQRDPLDRLLAAQAIVEGLTLLTPDEVFKGYAVRTVC